MKRRVDLLRARVAPVFRRTTTRVVLLRLGSRRTCRRQQRGPPPPGRRPTMPSEVPGRRHRPASRRRPTLAATAAGTILAWRSKSARITSSKLGRVSGRRRLLECCPRRTGSGSSGTSGRPSGASTPRDNTRPGSSTGSSCKNCNADRCRRRHCRRSHSRRRSGSSSSSIPRNGHFCVSWGKEVRYTSGTYCS